MAGTIEPAFYTFYEGGPWVRWEAGPVDEADLVPLGSHRRHPYKIINGVELHSLATEDGRRWDCLSGWNRGKVKLPL